MQEIIFKDTQDELMYKILKEGNKFPITSSKQNLMNKKIDYKVLLLMTLLSNKQLEEDIDGNGQELWRYLYRNKLTHYQELVENISKNKLETIIKTINKMAKLDCRVVNIRKTEGNDIVYDINYTNNMREFVTIDTKIMEALIHSFNSTAIKVYVLLKYMCRNGKKKITQKWLIEQIGLSSKSNNNYSIITSITDELACGGYVNKYTVSNDNRTVNYYEVNSLEEWKNIRLKNKNRQN